MILENKLLTDSMDSKATISQTTQMEMKMVWLKNSIERSKSDSSNNVDSDIKYALKEYE